MEEEAFFRMLEEGAEEFSEKNPGFFAPQLQKAIDERDLRSLVNELASQLPFELGKKQQLLDCLLYTSFKKYFAWIFDFGISSRKQEAVWSTGRIDFTWCIS